MFWVLQLHLGLVGFLGASLTTLLFFTIGRVSHLQKGVLSCWSHIVQKKERGSLGERSVVVSVSRRYPQRTVNSPLVEKL